MSALPLEEREIQEQLKRMIAEQKRRRLEEILRKQQEQLALRKEKKKKKELEAYREAQLRRYRAVERKIVEQQLKQREEEEPHWKRENIVQLISEHTHPEAISQYEKAVLTPAIGWGMIRERLEKEAWKAKKEAKVEKTQAHLPPHLREELGMETIPSYKPSREAVKAATLSLAASGAAFTQGFVEGLVTPLLPHKIIKGAVELATNPAGVGGKIVEAVKANPLEVSRLAGQAVGAYVSFKALGKAASRFLRKTRTYEFVPEKTEGKLIVDREAAALVMKHSGKAVKTVAGKGQQEVSLAKTPYLRFLKIVGGRKESRTIVKTVETPGVKAAYFSKDYLLKKPLTESFKDLLKFITRKGSFRETVGSKKWVAYDIYYFKGPNIVKQLIGKMKTPTKPTTPKPMKPLYTSASTSTAQNLLQTVKQLAIQESLKRTITTTEPLVDVSKITATLTAAAVAGTQTSEKPAAQVDVSDVVNEASKEAFKATAASKPKTVEEFKADIEPLKGHYIRNLPKPDFQIQPLPKQVPVQVLTPKPKHGKVTDIVPALTTTVKKEFKGSAITPTAPPMVPMVPEPVPVDVPKPVPLPEIELPQIFRKKKKSHNYSM